MNLHTATVIGDKIILDEPEGWHVLTIGAYILFAVRDAAYVDPELKGAVALAVSALRWFRLVTSDIWEDTTEGLQHVRALQEWDTFAHPFQALLLETDEGRQWAALIPRRDATLIAAA